MLLIFHHLYWTHQKIPVCASRIQSLHSILTTTFLIHVIIFFCLGYCSNLPTWLSSMVHMMFKVICIPNGNFSTSYMLLLVPHFLKLLHWFKLPPAMSTGFLFVCFFILFDCCEACRILVPRLGIKPRPLAVEAQSPNHLTTSKVPGVYKLSCNLTSICRAQFFKCQL